MMRDIELYKELITFCNANQGAIETKFKREMEFTSFHEECYTHMFYKQRGTSSPMPVKSLKEIIPDLAAAYKKYGNHFISKRNESIKGLDIQKGQWYEKALQLFLRTKDIVVTKKGFPFPDYEVSVNGRIVGYYELKYIKAPFLTAHVKIKNVYPYSTTRYDYEASLTLDTGKKMKDQRKKIEELMNEGYPVHYIWWYDCFHIKGLFAMHAKDVFDYHDNISGDLLVRKQREGDLLDHQELGKIYPPMLNMLTFSELLQTYEA